MILAAGIVGVLAVAIGQLGGATSSARTERQQVTAATGVVQSTISATGNLTPVTDEDVDFQTSGTLAHVFVTEGEHVHRGQLLATLEDTTALLTLRAARATLTQARTTLASDEKTLADGDASSASVTSDTSDTSDVGDDGTVEFVDAVPASSTTATSAAGVTRTRPTVGAGTTTATAPSTTTPQTTTSTTSQTTTQPVRTVTETVTTPASSTTPAVRSGRTTITSSAATSPAATTATTGSSSSSSSSSSSASSVTAATVASDRLQVAEDEQTVTSDAQAVRETRLRAPVSGTLVSLESLQPGDSVTSGTDSGAASSTDASSGADTSTSSASTGGGASSASTSASSATSSSSSFAEIDSLRHLSMTVTVTESDIGELKVGQAATVSLDALSGVELAARVSAVSSIGTTSSDVVSYDATLTLTQHDRRVKPGMSASATIVVTQGHGVSVPSGAVTGTGTLATVSELVDGHVRTRKVIVGIRGDSRDLIVSGLKAGATLVETETLPSEGAGAQTTSTSSDTSASGALGGATGGGGFGGGTGGPPSGGGGPP